MTELTQVEQDYFSTHEKDNLPEEVKGGDLAGGTSEEEGAADMESKSHSSRMVPHGALHAERAEHKRTRAELQQLRAEAHQMQQALQAVMTPMQGQDGGADRADPPDPRTDFLGFTRWQVEEINRLKSQVTEEKQRQDREKQAAEIEKLLWQEWNQSVVDVRAEHADIDDALNFLMQARDRQLNILGQIDLRFQNQVMRENQMQAELREIVVASFQQGKNPARTVYEIARAYGYGSKGRDKFTRLHDAQVASRTLTSSMGKEAGDPMLLETVANLSEKEFAKWYENNKDSFRKMFGG